MGVRRAVEMARQAAEEKNTLLENLSHGGAEAQREAFNQGAAPCSGVYTLGPLIHNKRVLKDLEEQGIACIEEGDNTGSFAPSRFRVSLIPSNSTVIIRAHGVSPAVETELRRQGLRILDATCPHVKESQKKAQYFSEKGYRVFLAGEKDHAEINGIRGCVTDCFVVANPQEAEEAAAALYRQEPAAKTALIGQTTIAPEEYRVIGEMIKQVFPKLEIANTICSATADRQEALRELCSQVDAVIIAGSMESANTRRLLSLAGELGKPAWLAETAGGLPSEIWNYETVGLSAGASAPDELIDEIEQALSAVFPENIVTFSAEDTFKL